LTKSKNQPFRKEAATSPIAGVEKARYAHYTYESTPSESCVNSILPLEMMDILPK
jgi:hypothetical protein